ncbi:MAG: DUF3556 domain-containing protein [Myxococcota bacterium]
MGLLDPVPPPYDVAAWSRLPIGPKAQAVCRAWALQGYGTPPLVFVAYAAKIGGYVGLWLAFCWCSPSLGGPMEVPQWWLDPLAFQKAIVASVLFEVMGLGCGSGPLTGRYLPPFAAVFHFLWPGTTKLPLVTGAPLVGGTKRTVVDALLYLALLACLVRAGIAPELDAWPHLWPLVCLIPTQGVLDKTVFLAARAEHYWVTLLVFAAAEDWIPGAKVVQAALWFWAGVSKLNHHFPSVVCVMTSNSPFVRSERARRRMYVNYPTDLTPSRRAVVTSHVGTALELGVPLLLVIGDGGMVTVVGLVAMVALHAYITGNVPMGVPLEWNVMVVYAGFFLFGAHAEVSLGGLFVNPALAGVVLTFAAVLPLVGNLWPERVSFLLSMRYYAGNWPYSVWLFRGTAYEKLARLRKSSRFVYDQLDRFYDPMTVRGLVGKVIGFRLMHLAGRVLTEVVPRAVDDARNYEWLDGELVAGLALGWNFGDGHLHDHRLLSAIQAQCGFEPGELRCIFVESQPLHRATMKFRIFDAAEGLREAGEVSVADLRRRQPWEFTGGEAGAAPNVAPRAG